MDAEYKPMTSEDLLKRGRCCKSTCVHCPYGHTVKKLGLQFKSIDDNEKYWVSSATSFIEKNGGKLDLDTYSADDYQYILLKEYICGAMRKDKLFVRELFLEVDYRNQGLTKELIESYYFY